MPEVFPEFTGGQIGGIEVSPDATGGTKLDPRLVGSPDGQASTGLQGATGQIIGFDGFGAPIFADSGGGGGATTTSGDPISPSETTGGGLDPNSLEGIDQQIAQLQAQIGAGTGGQVPDYSAFFKSPGYQFRLDEGIRASDRSAAARGMLMSGGHMRELQRYGQGLASSEFGNYANRLAAIAGIGQSATFGSGQLGGQIAGQVGQSAANIGQSIMAGGTAQASGIIGGANAFSQGIGNVGSALQQWGGGSGNAFNQGMSQGIAGGLFGAGWNASPSTASNIAWF